MLNSSLNYSESVIQKYDSTGSLIWTTSTLISLVSYDIVSANNSLYVLETVYDSINFIYRSAVSRHDFNGQLLSLSYDSINAETVGWEISKDKNENVYVVGISNEALPGTKTFLSRLDTNGYIVWKALFNDSYYIFADSKKMCFDDSANIYITGYASHINTTTSYDCIILKYDSSGLLKWFRTWTIPGNNLELPEAIACNNNRVAATGSLEFNNGNPDLANLFVVCYDLNGNLLFTDTLNDENDNGDFGKDLLIDSNNNVIVVGAYGGPDSSLYNTYIILNYDWLGNRSILDTIHTAGGDIIKMDTNGFLYVSGYSVDTVNNIDYHFLLKYDLLLTSIAPSVIDPFDYNLYPNPFKNGINISTPENLRSPINIIVFDMFGSKKVEKNVLVENKFYLDLSELKFGCYMIAFRNSGITIFRKIIKI